MNHPTSHSPWVLNHIIELDRHTPICGAFFRFSDERRHVVSAYLSARPPNDRMRKLGQFLLEADHRTILRAAYDEVPQGLRRALRRAGPTVRESRFYTLLHHVLSKPHHDEVANCVAQLGTLDLTKLLVLRMLPSAICRPNVIAAIRSTQEANDVETAFRLLISRDVDADALAGSIRQVRDSKGLTKVFRNALLKARAPEHPVPATEGYAPVRSGDELYAVARQFQNCLRSYIARFMDEAEGHAFAVAIHGEAKVVVHLTRDSDDWELEGVFGPRNTRPSSDLRDWVSRYLTTHGVKVEDRYRRKSSDWDALRRLTSDHLLGFEFD